MTDYRITKDFAKPLRKGCYVRLRAHVPSQHAEDYQWRYTANPSQWDSKLYELSESIAHMTAKES